MAVHQPVSIWDAYPQSRVIDGLVCDCPYCLRPSRFERLGAVDIGNVTVPEMGAPPVPLLTMLIGKCLGCSGLVIGLNGAMSKRPALILYPRRARRGVPPAGVDGPIEQSYREACEVLSVSPMAAAALARRCLQCLLRMKMGIKRGNLFEEIAEAERREELSKLTRDRLHHVREFGNFAAHPKEDKSGGPTLTEDPARVIVEVTPDQAEYTLQVIERMLDDLYVTPLATAEMDVIIKRIKGTPAP